MRGWFALILLAPLLAVASMASASPTFVDVTDSAGAGGPIYNSYVHAGSWGDVDGNGWPDLFVGTFVSGATTLPDQLLLNSDGAFSDANQSAVEVSGRAAGAVFADLDGDGDDDLFLSNNEKVRGRGSAVEPSHLFRNDGGTLVDVTAGSGIEAQSSNGRQVGVLDYNGDELLDLFVVADSFAGGGPTVLLRNDGGMQFSDVTAAAGLPTTVRGLGLAIGDVSGDGWSDIFVAGGPSLASPNINYLFIANGDSTFRSVANHGLDWTPFAVGSEDWVSSGAFGDVDRDGRLDLLIGHHFGTASNTGPGVPIRLYMNRGLDAGGDPILEDVTTAVGLPAIDSKAPHVDIQDFDNDGWPDLYTSVTVDGSPLIFTNTGVVGGNPTFAIPSVTNPHYYPVGPVADFNLDGRLDIFLGEFRSVYQGTPNDEGVVPSVLLANQSPGANWLDVRVAGADAGIGSTVAIYVTGQAGEPDALLGYSQIVVGNGFSSSGLPIAHFGLGSETAVDVVVTAPRGGASFTISGVAANQRIVADGDDPPPPPPTTTTTTTTTQPPTTTTTTTTTTLPPTTTTTTTTPPRRPRPPNRRHRSIRWRGGRSTKGPGRWRSMRAGTATTARRSAVSPGIPA